MQYHLTGKGFSGRGVRVAALDPDMASLNMERAAKAVGKDGTVIEIKKREWHEGVKLFVTHYTNPCAELGPETKWIATSAQDLDQKFTQVFTAKDSVLLEHVFRDLHEVSEADVNAIMGKAQEVSKG